MFVVMNVVQVHEDKREAFESRFAESVSHLHKAEGFAGFELLRREGDGGGEYLVTSRWEDEDAFTGWLESDLFKQSHQHSEGEFAHSNEVRRYTVIGDKVTA